VQQSKWRESSFARCSNFVRRRLMLHHRLSYEQYGSKLEFAFCHAHSEIFLFVFIFSILKAKSKRFGGHSKYTRTLG
ncbi:MAG: hypothetical protein ABJD55_03275, partial [Flavobacteriaceae bacterium]